MKHCKYLLRIIEYEEIVKTNTVHAISYLQTRLSEIIDHSDPQQLQEFHKLASLIFNRDKIDNDRNTSNESDMNYYSKSLSFNESMITISKSLRPDGKAVLMISTKNYRK